VPALLGLILFGRPAIRILFERGEFTAAAGDVTYAVLVVYAVALPAYVITEVVTRGLIALRDTRTPLLTNSLQLAGRALLMSLTLTQLGVTAIPLAFAITSTLEALALTTVLMLRIQRRQRTTQPTAPHSLGQSA
jgi:putative peptidoglycan lipid II flippase